MGSLTSTVSRKNVTVTLREVARRFKFRSIFHAPSRKFKILAIPDVLAHVHGKSYEHGFVKKCDGHKLCVELRAEVEFRSVLRAPSRKFKILAILNVLAHESSFNQFFVHCSINFREVASRVEFLSVFRAPSRKFKILANPNVLAHGKSYEHKNVTVITLCEVARRVEFRSVLCAQSRKFKILAIPDVLAHGKSYDYGFTKKHDGQKLYVELSFDWFFLHRLGNSKYWPFPMY
ncbi:hypothetical protein BHM03_00046824 [Ensete ventricosum]|nr:hypothetical protein BHM03_00046824 [Ensete ventricosum]